MNKEKKAFIHELTQLWMDYCRYKRGKRKTFKDFMEWIWSQE